MRLGRNRDRLAEENGNVTDLSVRGAVEMLAPRPVDAVVRFEGAKAEMQSLQEQLAQPVERGVDEELLMRERVIELCDIMLEAAIEDKFQGLAKYAASGEYRVLPKRDWARQMGERLRRKFCDESGAIDRAKLNSAVEDCFRAVLEVGNGPDGDDLHTPVPASNALRKWGAAE
ncbi:MAG: hypothetical protein J2P48_14665 [Alphaproteobacteria bacterium]|nr:hypothetical protein [Alphaproteobacteria bacterium]